MSNCVIIVLHSTIIYIYYGLFILFLFFPVQQTTNGIGHRAKYLVVFRVGNQYAECEKHVFLCNLCTFCDTFHIKNIDESKRDMLLDLVTFLPASYRRTLGGRRHHQDDGLEGGLRHRRTPSLKSGGMA